jgi:threonine dehydrogenase-like Zn-dependent dehydrogenase
MGCRLRATRRLKPLLLTHDMSLEESPMGYELFKEKKDNCVRAVFRP